MRRLIWLGLISLTADRLTKVWWGNSQNQGWFWWRLDQRWLVVSSLLVVFLLITWAVGAWKRKKAWLFLGLWLVILGGISNLYDRIVYGYVIDWWQSPVSVFNLADVMIVVGVGLILLELVIRSKLKGGESL